MFLTTCVTSEFCHFVVFGVLISSVFIRLSGNPMYMESREATLLCSSCLSKKDMAWPCLHLWPSHKSNISLLHYNPCYHCPPNALQGLKDLAWFIETRTESKGKLNGMPVVNHRSTEEQGIVLNYSAVVCHKLRHASGLEHSSLKACTAHQVPSL